MLRKTEQEREQLYVLVGELKETIASQKERLEELTRLNEEQDILLKSQKAALDSKVTNKKCLKEVQFSRNFFSTSIPYVSLLLVREIYFQVVIEISC